MESVELYVPKFFFTQASSVLYYYYYYTFFYEAVSVTKTVTFMRALKTSISFRICQFEYCRAYFNTPTYSLYSEPIFYTLTLSLPYYELSFP